MFDYLVRTACPLDKEMMLSINAKVDHRWNEKLFNEVFAGDFPIFIIEQGTRIIGYAIWAVVFDECRLLNLTIEPSHQRQGCASWLLNKSLRAICNEYQLRCSILNVRTDNLAACALYRKFGYRILCRRDKYYTNYNDQDAYFMMLEPLDNYVG